MADKLEAAEQQLQRSSGASAFVLDSPPSAAAGKKPDTKLSQAMRDVYVQCPMCREFFPLFLFRPNRCSHQLRLRISSSKELRTSIRSSYTVCTRYSLRAQFRAHERSVSGPRLADGEDCALQPVARAHTEHFASARSTLRSHSAFSIDIRYALAVRRLQCQFRRFKCGARGFIACARSVHSHYSYGCGVRRLFKSY